MRAAEYNAARDAAAGATMLMAALAETRDEDALLLEALSFIGDFDFDKHDDERREDLASLPDEPVLLQGGDVSAEAPAPIHLTFGIGQIQPSPTLTAPEKTSPEVPASKSTSTQNHARDRRRHEIIYLRELVGTLEKTLNGLRPSPSEDCPERGQNGRNELVGLWAQVASRQYEQRQRSEMENITLKRLLHEQIQLGKRLERVLRKKRPHVESLEPKTGLHKRIRCTNAGSWKSRGVFDELLANCVVQYGDATTILAQLVDPTSPRGVNVVYDSESGRAKHTKERRILPFSYEDTATELWGFHPLNATGLSIHGYYDVDHTDETIKIQFQVSLDINHAHGEFAVKLAARRFVESNRILIILSGLVEPTGLSEAKMKGERVRLSCWNVVEPIKSRAATNLTSYHVVVPQVDDDQPGKGRELGTWAEVLLSVLSFELDCRSRHLENRLLERVFSRPPMS